MGDINQLDFISTHRKQCQGSFLEVGSHDYGSTQNIRRIFAGDDYAGEDYIGIDINDGANVDLVLDLTQSFEKIDKALGGRRFRTIFCLSVLEHCDQPFVMAEHMSQLLAPGGRIFISVPFAWKFHGYPSDYWRFTHEGVKKLFPDLVFNNASDNMSTSRRHERRELNEDIGIIAISSHWHRKLGHPARAISVMLLRLLTRVGVLRWLVGYRYVMAPTMINMVGIKPEK